VKAFRRALDIDPGHTDASLGLSMVLNDTGRYEEARKVFTEGRDKLQQVKKEQLDSFLVEQLATKHMELGDIYFQCQRYEEASDQYFEAYKYTTDKLKVRMKIVECFIKKNEWGRAIKELRLIAQEHPNAVDARLKLGLLYYKQNQTVEAVEQWEAILLRDPEHPEALKYLKMAQSNETTTVLL
jgi:tetratricopeptide (TPR) repeat protein